MTTKKQRSAISDKKRCVTYFNFLTKLLGQDARLACYYEYWRLSPDHIQMVQIFRDSDGAGPSPCFPQEFLLKCTRNSQIYPVDILLALSLCIDFPKKHITKSSLRKVIWTQSRQTPGVGVMPWAVFLAMFDHLLPRIPGDCQTYEVRHRHTGWFAIGLDWELTNAQLVESFKRLVKDRIRPVDRPEPSKGGRRSLKGGSAASDMLAQLCALRFHEAGIERREIKEKEIKDRYSQDEGWNQAIKEAQKRISNLTTVPLFRQ